MPIKHNIKLEYCPIWKNGGKIENSRTFQFQFHACHSNFWSHYGQQLVRNVNFVKCSVADLQCNDMWLDQNYWHTGPSESDNGDECQLQMAHLNEHVVALPFCHFCANSLKQRFQLCNPVTPPLPSHWDKFPNHPVKKY